MRILEAFDLTQSYRAAGELAGCDHHTVAGWVARRDAGELTATPVRRRQVIDGFLAKVEEWMEASNGKIRADVAHDKLAAMGYVGSERTTRRAVAAGALGVAGGASPSPSTVGARAGVVVAVGLRGRAAGRRGGDVVVLRVVGVVPVPGGAADPRQVVADGDRLPGHDVASVWGLPDVRVDGQRKDGDGRTHRPDRYPQPGHGGGGGPLRR